MQPDLKAALNKLGVQVLNLLTSRKFWAAVAAELALIQQYQAHAIDGNVFAGLTVGTAVALMGSIAYEDGQAKQAPTADTPKPAA